MENILFYYWNINRGYYGERWIAALFYISGRGTAAAAESLHSCPTLCDPIDGSPPQAPPSLGFSRKNTGVGCHFLFHWKRQKLWSFLLQSCHWSCSVGWLWSVLHIAAALVSFLSTNRYPNVRAEGSYLRSTSLILWSTFSSELFSNFKCISGALKLNTQACSFIDLLGNGLPEIFSEPEKYTLNRSVAENLFWSTPWNSIWPEVIG